MRPTVSFFSTALTGGAGIAAQRLYQNLQPYEATFSFYTLQNFVPQASSGIDKWVQKIKTSLYYTNIEKYFANRPDGLELFSPATLPTPTPLSQCPELLHLHWVNSLVDVPSFFATVPTSTPIVWTLHDCNTFTGGCHYTNGCTKYEQKCEKCPQLGLYRHGLLALEGQQTKYKSLKDKNLHIVTPSKWLQNIAENSFVLQHAKSFQTISNGLDIAQYSPMDTHLAKVALGILPTTFVICFGAERMDTHRKGFALLLQSIEKLVEKNINFHLLTFGKNNTIPPQKYPHTHLGEVNSSPLQRLMYGAANVLVVPSLEDNQPLTCMEAQSCGTPVVAFEIGGLTEMICHQFNGLLAKAFSVEDLAYQLEFLALHPDKAIQLGENARKNAVQYYDGHLQAHKYWELYQQILRK